MHKTLFTFILMISFNMVFAQKKQNVYYMKDGIPITDKNLADSRRIIQEPDPGKTYYNFYEFYINNEPKTEGFLSSFEPNLVFEGPLIRYNKQGKVTEKTFYKKGKLFGQASYFYSNGKPARVLLYNDSSNSSNLDLKYNSKLEDAYDSTGIQMIKNGNGFYKDQGKFYIEEGNYLNGYKDGEWKGTVEDQKFTEIYKDGTLILGIAYLTDGTKKEYKIADELPTYVGGISNFYKYLGRNYKFPSDALRNRISGKLYISFAVEKDGKLSDFKFKNDLGYGTIEEAVRVLSQSPKWNPGKRHGIPVRVKYNININLSPPH